jgi:hypothetical protein
MAIVLYARARAYMSRSHCRVEARPPKSKAKLKADEGDRYQNQRTAAFTSEILSTQSALSGHPIQFPSCAKRTLLVQLPRRVLRDKFLHRGRKRLYRGIAVLKDMVAAG